MHARQSGYFQLLLCNTATAGYHGTYTARRLSAVCLPGWDLRRTRQPPPPEGSPRPTGQGNAGPIPPPSPDTPVPVDLDLSSDPLLVAWLGFPTLPWLTPPPLFSSSPTGRGYPRSQAVRVGESNAQVVANGPLVRNSSQRKWVWKEHYPLELQPS